MKLEFYRCKMSWNLNVICWNVMELEFISEDGHGTSILSVEDAMELEFYQ